VKLGDFGIAKVLDST